jgi:hypothetical protein
MQLWLNEKELLEIDDPKRGNIYTLIYNNRTQKEVCAAFNKPSDDQINDLIKFALQLKDILNEPKNNIYPKISEKIKWYDSQQKLLEFCEFMENESMRENTNIAKMSDKSDEYKHIKKCRELVNAMNYIIYSIEKE